MSAHNEPIRVYPEGVSWDEAWRQRQRADALEVDVERLNQMLKETGYGQGQIDAFVAQCEEMEKIQATIDELTQDRNRFLRERDEARAEVQRLRAAMNLPYKIGVRDPGVVVEAEEWKAGGGT